MRDVEIARTVDSVRSASQAVIQTAPEQDQPRRPGRAREWRQAARMIVRAILPPVDNCEIDRLVVQPACGAPWINTSADAERNVELLAIPKLAKGPASRGRREDGAVLPIVVDPALGQPGHLQSRVRSRELGSGIRHDELWWLINQTVPSEVGMDVAIQHIPFAAGYRAVLLVMDAVAQMFSRSKWQILPERILDQKSSTIVLLLRRSRGKQIDDLLDGFVGAVISGFQFTGRLMTGDGAVVEAAVWRADRRVFCGRRGTAAQPGRLLGRGGRRSGIHPAAAGHGL